MNPVTSPQLSHHQACCGEAIAMGAQFMRAEDHIEYISSWQTMFP